MHPDCAPHPFADRCPPADGLPTEEFTEEQVRAAYAELFAGVPVDLPDEFELDAMFEALGIPDPFRG
jgi:hypothetical protein